MTNSPVLPVTGLSASAAAGLEEQLGRLHSATSRSHSASAFNRVAGVVFIRIDHSRYETSDLPLLIAPCR